MCNLYLLDVGLRHLNWGILLLFSNVPIQTTPLNALAYLSDSHVLKGSLLILATVLAFAGLVRNEPIGGWRGAFFFGMQQALTMLAALGPIVAIYYGHYADLEPRPREFIYADQFPHVQVAVFHTVALFAKQQIQRGAR